MNFKVICAPGPVLLGLGLLGLVLLGSPYAAEANQPGYGAGPSLSGSNPSITGGQHYNAPLQHPYGEPGGGPQQPLPPPPQAYGEPGGSFAAPQTTHEQRPHHKSEFQYTN
jgi:hypothetical protein